MRTYPLWIDGRDEYGKGWVHVLPVQSMIDDADGSLTLRRQLDLGRVLLEDQAPGAIAGRCAFDEVDCSVRAVEAARRAQPALAEIPLEDRIAIAADLHMELRARREELLEILEIEGHPPRLAEWELSGMLAYTCPESLEYMMRLMRDEVTLGSHRIRLVRKPDGVVCLSPPQNAACSNSFVGVLALVAGNALVVKAPRSVPLGVMYLYRDIVRPVLARHGVPDGALNIICGASPGIMRHWTQSPLVDDIVFFGESRTGIRIGEECFKKGKKTWLELSGNDGFVVWRDADLDRAAETLVECFYGSSQICMVPKYAIVHPDVAEAFIERFLPRARALRPGYPKDPETLLTPVLKPARFFEMLSQATAAGASRLCGGERVDVAGERSYKGLFLEPTVVRVDGLAAAGELDCVREETFFPLLPIVVPRREDVSDAAVAASGFHDALLDRVISFVDANDYGLRASLWSESDAVVEHFLQKLDRVGIIKVNESHIGFPPVISVHGGPGLTGGPFGELSYPMLRVTHLQGASIRAKR